MQRFLRALTISLLAGCSVAPAEPTRRPPRHAPRVAATTAPRAEPLPAARYAFPSSDRRARLEKAYSVIDVALAKRAKDANAPGLAFALYVDGELAHVFHHGVADEAEGTPVDAETRFRIGSITKTFTALALAKLRDDGKLRSFEEPIENVLPEVRTLRAASADAGPIRFRDITLHHGGLIRNGDYDESYREPIGRAELIASLRLPALATPYEGYGYSNFGYGLLAIAIEALSGESYQSFVERTLTRPLGLGSAAWARSSVPAAHRSRSYGGKHGEVEAEWRLGKLDASGGLFLSAKDVARWASFHAEAFPPRDTPDDGPVARATVRELLSIGTSDPPNHLQHALLQTPLGWDALKACGERVFWKTGSVEGFGSHVLFLPDHGVAFASLANVNMDLHGAQREVLEALRATGGLERREKQPSPELERAVGWWLADYDGYDEERVRAEYTKEFWRFNDFQDRAAWMRKQRARTGACERKAMEVVDHAGAGRFAIRCDRASASISLTLDGALRQIAWSTGRWRYRPTVEQGERARDLLAHLTTNKPFWGGSATAEQRANQAKLVAELRGLGPGSRCQLGVELDTDSPDESLHEVRCRGEVVRQLRTFFDRGDPKTALRAALEPVPRPAAACRPW